MNSRPLAARRQASVAISRKPASGWAAIRTAQMAKRFNGAVHRIVGEPAGRRQAFAEPNDARERTNDAEPVRPGWHGQQQATIVGAEIERGKYIARRLARADGSRRSGLRMPVRGFPLQRLAPVHSGLARPVAPAGANYAKARLQPRQPAPRLPADPAPATAAACLLARRAGADPARASGISVEHRHGGRGRLRPQRLPRRRCDRAERTEPAAPPSERSLPVRPAAADGPSARKSASGFSFAGACGRGTCPHAACCRREDCPQRIPVAVRDNRQKRNHGRYGHPAPANRCQRPLHVSCANLP